MDPRYNVAAMSLKRKILLLIVTVYILTVIMAVVATLRVTNHLVNRLGAGYAAKYALANKALVQEPLIHDMTLARQIADSPVIRHWVQDETNDGLRAPALAELEGYRKRLSEQGWFMVIHPTLHYYSNDRANQYAGRELVYSLSPTNSQDAWYFSTLATVPQIALNVNYDRGLDVRKVWINVVMRDDAGKPLGMAGTGLDLSGFLATFMDHSEPGVEHMLLDQRLAIQAHRNRALIDLQTIATPASQRSTVNRILQRPEDQQALNDAIIKLRSGSPAETLYVTTDGNPRLLGVAFIPDLEWYALTLLDLDVIIGRRILVSVVTLVLIVTLILLGAAGWIVNRIALKPLADVTQAARDLSLGNYTPLPPMTRQDEIGTLSRTFSDMSARIHNHTATLESRIRERTAQLDETNRSLRESLDKLNEAHSKVRLLSGMLPLCCSCNRIRDDKDQWKTMDVYVKEHSEAEFSHGICPECMTKLYPGFSAKPTGGKEAPPG